MSAFSEVTPGASAEGGSGVRCGTGDLFPDLPSTTASPPKPSGDGQDSPQPNPKLHLGLAGLLPAFLGAMEVKGVGAKGLKSLLTSGAIGGLAKAQSLSEQRDVLDSFRSKLPESAAKALRDAPELLLDLGAEVAASMDERGIALIFRDEAQFPARLGRMSSPPEWLFVQGNLEAVSSLALVSVIGSREASEAGLALAEKTGAALARRSLGVVSGLARGVDMRAHVGALDNYGLTIAVLGQGLDSRLSSDQENISSEVIWEGGAIVTEYLMHERPNRANLLRRNELVAALSQLVIPIECPSGATGTAATIRRAQAIGTPVAGLAAKHSSSEKLRQTEAYLASQGIPIFALENGRYEALVDLLSQCIPSEAWANLKEERHERIATGMANMVAQSLRPLRLSKEETGDVLDRIHRLLNTEQK